MGGSENSELGLFIHTIGADGVRSAEAYACACKKRMVRVDEVFTRQVLLLGPRFLQKFEESGVDLIIIILFMIDIM